MGPKIDLFFEFNNFNLSKTIFCWYLFWPFYTRPFYIRPFYIRPFYIRPFYIWPFYIRPFYIRPFYIRPFYIRPLFSSFFQSFRSCVWSIIIFLVNFQTKFYNFENNLFWKNGCQKKAFEAFDGNMKSFCKFDNFYSKKSLVEKRLTSQIFVLISYCFVL